MLSQRTSKRIYAVLPFMAQIFITVVSINHKKLKNLRLRLNSLQIIN